MSTSEILSEVDNLLAIAEQLQSATGVSLPYPFNTLLTLIGELINKLLNTAIGGSGKTIKEIIDGIKTSITGTVSNIGAAISNTKDSILSSIGDIIGDAGTTLSGIKNSITGSINGAVTTLKTSVSNVTSAVGLKIDDAVGAIGKAVRDTVGGVETYIDNALGGVGQAIRDTIGNLINKFNDVIDAIKGIAADIGNSIAEAIHQIAGNIASAVADAIDSVGGFIDGLIQGFKDSVSNIAEGIRDAIKGVITWVSDKITGAYQAVKDAIANLVAGLKSTYETVKGTIVDKVNEILAWLREVGAKIGEAYQKALVAIGEWIANNFLPAWGRAVEWAQKISGLSPAVLDDLKRGDFDSLFDGVGNIFTNTAKAAVDSPLFALATAIAYFWNEVQLQFIPSQVAAQMRARISLALDPIGLDVGAQAVYKGIWSNNEYLNNASLAGVAGSRAKAALDANRPIPSPGQAQELFLRGEIPEQEHDKILSSYGFSQEHITEIKSLYYIIPGVADIITMAVREAFTPEIAERFGQYEDLPDAFVGWAAKQGLSKEWAERYWASHWQLPSPQMGFDMLHRRIVDQDDLKLLLKALDVMPFWREKLIQLSYNPITRVDVRRMYKVGVFDEQQVYDAYLDLGYSPDSATNLTEFTKIYSPPEDATTEDIFKELARSTYSQAYKRNIISRDEYQEFLKSLGYAAPDIQLLISIDDYNREGNDKLFDVDGYRKDFYKLSLQAYDRGILNQDTVRGMLADLGLEDDEIQSELYLIDYNRQLSLRSTLLNQLHDQYVEFTIDASELSSILNQFEFTADEQAKIQQEWDIERTFRTRKPTLADFKRFFAQGLISIDQLITELRGLGYPDKYVQLYVDSLATT